MTSIGDSNQFDPLDFNAWQRKQAANFNQRDDIRAPDPSVARRVGNDLSQAPNHLANELNEILSKLELTKTGQFTGTDDNLIFKVNYPYLKETGFLQVQRDLLEVNKVILGNPQLNESVLNYKVESFPLDQFPTRNKISFTKADTEFQYGSEIINIPNIPSPVTQKPIFSGYDSSLLVPVLVGPPSLADLKTASGIPTKMMQGISSSALEVLEKAARREGDKDDFYIAHTLHPVLLPNAEWCIINDQDCLRLHEFNTTQNFKFALEPIVLPAKATVELARKEGLPYYQPPTTPPMINEFLNKADIMITDGHPRDDYDNGNQKRFITTNLKIPLLRDLKDAVLGDLPGLAGLNFRAQQDSTRRPGNVELGIPLDDLPAFPTSFLYDQDGKSILPDIVKIRKNLR